MYLEEFEKGQTFELDPVSMTEEELFDFANKYDPQPIHIDKEFAENSIFKGFIASGFHTIGLVWSEWIRSNKFGNEIIGGIGIDHLQWLAPVRANDKLYTKVEVLHTKPSSKGGKGIIELAFVVTNQDDVEVLKFQPKAILKAKN